MCVFFPLLYITEKNAYSQLPIPHPSSTLHFRVKLTFTVATVLSVFCALRNMSYINNACALQKEKAHQFQDINLKIS